MKKVLSSESDMKTWGERLGRLLRGGEFIELIGDVGAGKTTLTKGIARGLAITETVQSPTFTISRLYEARDNLRLAHYDFYRLAEAGIMADELAETGDDPNTITVIEWGDVVADVRPIDHVTITITSPGETERIVSIDGSGYRSSKLIRELA